MTHTIIEIAPPSYTYDRDGNPTCVEWVPAPPAGFDDEVDGHNCATGELCPGWNGRRSAPVGFALTSSENSYGAEIEAVRWFYPFAVDGRWVVCEDCADAVEHGELIVSPDGVWSTTDRPADAEVAS